MEERENHGEEPGEEFGELIRYTLGGYLGGLAFGFFLDYLGFAKSGAGQWVVRTLSGEGESLFEGFFAFRKRFRGGTSSMAEAYGWGKLFGMALPWAIDGASRLTGVDVYGIEGFYIPFFYALSDQAGANVSGLFFLRKASTGWREAVSRYFHHPVMMTGLAVLLVAPAALFLARLMGFSPSTQVRTALETILANLCWLPPLIGWMAERKNP